MCGDRRLSATSPDSLEGVNSNVDHPSFSQELAQLVSLSFVSVASNQEPRNEQRKMTFHQCLRTVMGTNPEWSLLAYRKGDSLFEFAAAVYQCISVHLGVNSEHWLVRSDRTADEVAHVVQVLREPLDALEIPSVQVRPGIRRVQGPGKPRAAVAVEAAVAASQRRTSYGMALGEGLVASSCDRGLIAWLEKSANAAVDEKRVDWTVAKAFSLAAGAWLRSSEETTVRAFCSALEVDFSSITNDHLLIRLDEVRRLSDARLRSS